MSFHCPECNEDCDELFEYEPTFLYVGNAGKQMVCEECKFFLIAEETREKEYNDVLGTVDVEEIEDYEDYIPENYDQ